MCKIMRESRRKCEDNMRESDEYLREMDDRYMARKRARKRNEYMGIESIDR